MIFPTTVDKSTIEIDGISRLTPADVSLFRTMAEDGEISFADSWLYLLRATRNDRGELGYKYYKDGTFIGIGYRKGAIYLTHPLGDRRFDAVLELSTKLFSSTRRQIILKKVDEELARRLAGTREFVRQDLNSGNSILEDEAYVEKMVALDRLISEDLEINPEAHTLRRKVERFQKNGQKLDIRCGYWTNDTKALGKSLNELVRFNQDKYASYISIAREVFSNSDTTRYMVSSFHLDDKMHGLYVGEFLSKAMMGLYCALSSAAIPGITEWMDVYFLTQARVKGVHLVLLGGAETRGVEQYVEKLLPETTPYVAYTFLYKPRTKIQRYRLDSL